MPHMKVYLPLSQLSISSQLKAVNDSTSAGLINSVHFHVTSGHFLFLVLGCLTKATQGCTDNVTFSAFLPNSAASSLSNQMLFEEAILEVCLLAFNAQESNEAVKRCCPHSNLNVDQRFSLMNHSAQSYPQLVPFLPFSF